MSHKGAFDEYAELIVRDLTDALSAAIEGKPYVSKIPKVAIVYYKYKALKTFSFTYVAQDVNNGTTYSFEEGKEYDMRTPTDDVYSPFYPYRDSFEFIKQWKKVV